MEVRSQKGKGRPGTGTWSDFDDTTQLTGAELGQVEDDVQIAFWLNVKGANGPVIGHFDQLKVLKIN